MNKEKKNTIVELDTESVFFDDLLFGAVRYAIGRHTGMALTLPEEILRTFYKAMSEHSRKWLGVNTRDVRMNDILWCCFRWEWGGNVSSEDRDSHSLINIILGYLIDTKQLDKIFFIRKAYVNKNILTDKFDVKLELMEERNEYQLMDLDDLFVWNDFIQAMAGETKMITIDSGKVQQEVECIESFIRRYDKEGKSGVVYERIYRPLEDFIKNPGVTKYVDPDLIIAKEA